MLGWVIEINGYCYSFELELDELSKGMNHIFISLGISTSSNALKQLLSLDDLQSGIVALLV